MSLADPRAESGATQVEHAWASVTLPVAIDLPARYAVPVQVRAEDGVLTDRIPADGQYHQIVPGEVTFLTTLPDGRSLQASTECVAGTSVRVTLQGGAGGPAGSRRARPPPLQQQRSALRYFVQSSLDSYKSTRTPSIASSVVASADELRLELTKHDAGVQFLQLGSKAFPMNVAHTSGSTVKLVSVERRLAADVSLLDERVELALDYLQNGRPDDATLTLRLQGLTLKDAEAQGDVNTAIVSLHIALASGPSGDGLDKVEQAALRLAERNPDVSDFLIVAAECAAGGGRHADALRQLAGLQQAGLPLLYRSFVMASRLLRDYAIDDFKSAGADADSVTLAAVHGRLSSLAPYVDPVSRILVIEGAAPDSPGSEPPFWRRVAAPLRRLVGGPTLEIESTPTLEKGEAVTASTTGTVDAGGEDATKTTITTTPAPTTSNAKVSGESKPAPTKLALVVAAIALLAWAVFTIVMITKSDSSEVEWARITYVFASVEAVAFAAAGLLFGTTVNRQRAENAEQRADENQKAAESGRALAGSLKAEEPAVVQEGGGAGGPQALGGGRGDDAATQVAARHARLARQFFP
jgi:hypothetical protein